MTVLIVSRLIPASGDHGANAYLTALVDFLRSKGVHVVILPVGFVQPTATAPPWSVESFAGRVAWVCSGFVGLGQQKRNLFATARTLALEAISRVRRLCCTTYRDVRPWLAVDTWGDPITPLERAVIGLYAKLGFQWDAVLLNYHWLAPAAKYFTNSCTIVVTHDVWHEHAFRSGNPHLAGLDRDKEKHLLDMADISLAISRKDEAKFAEMLGAERVIYAPMAMTPALGERKEVAGRILFVGSGYYVNAEGIRWFVEKVLDRIPEHCRQRLELRVVGNVCERIRDLEGKVQLVGRVADLQREYEEAELVIVPILVSTGMSVKLVEALAHGKAVVATETAARSLLPAVQGCLSVARDETEFAGEVTRLMRNELVRKELSARALDFARRELSPEQCYRDLFREIMEAAKRSRMGKGAFKARSREQ